jgi:hypothetical protein
MGSQGEQISNSHCPKESATRFPPIVIVCVKIWSRADSDGRHGNDGDGNHVGDASAKCILVTGSLQECLRGCGV